MRRLSLATLRLLISSSARLLLICVLSPLVPAWRQCVDQRLDEQAAGTFMSLCHSAKKAADKEAQRDEAAVAAAAAAAGVTVPPGGGSPATATSPAADRDGSGGGSPRASAPAAERSPAAVAQRARSGDPTGQTGREAGGQAASAAAAAAGEAEAGEEREGGQAEAVVAPPRPTAVKHTDAAAKEAARERYLARKKRKAAGEPDA